MSLKAFCYFGAGIVGDGSSVSITANLLADPFVLGLPGAPSIPSQLNPAFAVTLSNLPSGIGVIASSDGQSVSASLGLAGAVTFTFPNAPVSGQLVTLYGKLEF